MAGKRVPLPLPTKWYPGKPEVAVQCMSNLVVAKNWHRFLSLMGDIDLGVFVEMPLCCSL